MRALLLTLIAISTYAQRSINDDNSDAVKGHRKDFDAMDTNKDGNLDAIEVKKFYNGS